MDEPTGNDKKDLWPMFDAYVKKVVYTANRSYDRQEVKRGKELAMGDVVILSYMDEGRADSYPSDRNYLLINGKRLPLNDPALFDALQTLPEKLLQVLVMKFWYEYNENQIAADLKVSLRSCYTRRKKALALLRDIMEGRNDGSSE